MWYTVSMYKKIGREIGEGLFLLFLMLVMTVIALVMGHAFVAWLFAGADPATLAAVVAPTRSVGEFACGLVVTFASGYLGHRSCGQVGEQVGEVVGNFIEMERKQ